MLLCLFHLRSLTWPFIHPPYGWWKMWRIGEMINDSVNLKYSEKTLFHKSRMDCHETWTKVYMQKRIWTRLLSTLVVLTFQTLDKSLSSKNLDISKLDLSTCENQSRKFKIFKWKVLVIVFRQGNPLCCNTQIDKIILNRMYTRL